MCASTNGSESAVDYLISIGANINLLSKVYSISSPSILELSSETHFVDVLPTCRETKRPFIMHVRKVMQEWLRS
jgi:hypothetical protein